MRQYTIERIEHCASRIDPKSEVCYDGMYAEASAMLRAYAATLKAAQGGVTEAMVEEGLSYFEKAGDAGDKAYVAAIRERIAALEAALSAEPAAQPEDSRCPPTYRREEAVKALIGMGWTWNGKAWSEPAALGDADELIDAYDEAVRRERESAFQPALAQQAARDCVSHNRNRLRKALTAPPAQPAERVPEWMVPVRRASLMYWLRELNGARRGDNAQQRADLVHLGIAGYLAANPAAPAAPADGDGKEVSRG